MKGVESGGPEECERGAVERWSDDDGGRDEGCHKSVFFSSMTPAPLVGH